MRSSSFKPSQVVKIQVGTSKGLVTFHDGEEVSYDFPGLNITAFHEDLVSFTHKHWGVKLFRNNEPLTTPTFPPSLNDVKGKAASLRQIWQLSSGGRSYPDRLWAATEPGALFRSDDMGESWNLIKGLWHHPTRTQNNQWFGAGKDLPFVHSIIVHPENNDCIYISVSCAGVFRTMNSGTTWELMNTGMKAQYLPNPSPIAGYDPHQVIMHPKNPSILWQQNHCGVYRTTDGGQLWTEVSPQYGFAIAIDEEDPQQAWIIPVENETSRIPKDRKLQVLHTKDGGFSWSTRNIGLPKENFYGIVLRNGFAKKGDLMTFGTTNGHVYFSEDRGESWRLITSNLAKVNYISFCK